jgi:predicted RNase H-like nuclease (RuvC/YqgF family)
MIRQLREARKEIVELKGQGLDERKNLKDLMDMYLETIDKAMFTTKRFFPLHRQLKNLYRQNKDLQAQIRRLKLELHPFKEELAQINLNVLAQAATRRSTRLRK